MSRLAESGNTNEALNARNAIERICHQYDISIEEILLECQEQKWYEFDVGRSNTMLHLFAQCYMVVTDKRRMDYHKAKGSSKVDVCLTAFEYAELKSMFAWHQSNFKVELKKMEDTLFQAYIHKHRMFSSKPDKESKNEEDTELTPEMLERIKRILQMKQNLSDNHYRKMIEQ